MGVWGITPELWYPGAIQDKNVPFPAGHLPAAFALFLPNFSLPLCWRLLHDSAKTNGSYPVEHILFHFVQYIMPINQQHMCKPPSCHQHSLRYARFGQHLDDKFSFWGPLEHTGWFIKGKTGCEWRSFNTDGVGNNACAYSWQIRRGWCHSRVAQARLIGRSTKADANASGRRIPRSRGIYTAGQKKTYYPEKQRNNLLDNLLCGPTFSIINILRSHFFRPNIYPCQR